MARAKRQARERQELVNVGFKADEDTLAYIDELIDASPPGVVAKKSVVIRAAIKEAALRMRKGAGSAAQKP